MKLRKGRGALIALGALAFIVGAAGMALAGSSKKKAKKEEPKEEESDEVVVIPPGAEGVPDGSAPPIVVLPPSPKVLPPPAEVFPPEPDFVPSDTDYKEDSRGPDALPLPLPPPSKMPTATPATDSQKEQQVVTAFLEQLPAGTKVSPIAVAEVKPALDPNGTVMLARSLLARENLPNWKSDMQAEVKAWQQKVGLKPDGLFGVVSAARMAEEVGILPLVRFWSKSYATKKKALDDFSAQIFKSAEKLQGSLPDSKMQILALGESVKREKGKTFAANPAANNTLAEVEAINQVLAKEAQTEAKKELANV